MRTHLPSSPKFFLSKTYLLTIVIIIGFCCNLSATVKPANKVKNKPANKAAYHDMKTGGLSMESPANAIGLPEISYAGPQVYMAGTTITPLSPTGGAVAAQAYSSSTTTLGSGFNIPAGLAVDAQGNIFIGDQNNNVVKEIPVGSNTPVTIATGFATPDGVAVDAQGNVYVADDGNNLIKEIPFVNGTYQTPVVLASAFTFSQPFDVAVDTKGNVYAADRGHNQVVEIPVGGGAAFVIGSGFATPTGVSVDAYGNVYVADNGNSAIKMIPAGNGTPVTLGSGFSNPFTASVDGSGNVFVADYGNKQVKEIPINGGAIQTVGSGYSFIFGTAVDKFNNVYVTDYGNNAVKEINPTGGYYISPALPLGLSFNNTTGTISGTPVAASPATIYTITAWNQNGSNSATLNITVNAVGMTYASPKTFVAGAAITPVTPTGAGGAAAPAYSVNTTTLGSGFNIPAGVAVDAHGNLFIGDQNNNVVKEIPGGTGTPVTIATGFATPDGVAVDAQGNVYVADDGNNLIKEIPFVNGAYQTPVVLASAFTFSQPFDVAVDNKGNVYAADRGHNQVVEIPVGGGAAFVIGSGFATPTGVSVDAYGNVYVADNGNSAIKMIPAGNGTPVTLGSGFSNPFTASVDGSGNVFVADYGNKQVKEIPINGGPIQTLGSGYSFIFGTAVDKFNNVYVTDYGHNAVKEINPIGGYYISPALPLGLSFNNTTGTISGTPLAASPATTYTITAYNQYGGNSTTINITVSAVIMTYASPQTYVAGTPITPLSPTGAGGAAAPAYSVNTTTLGSGFNIPAGVAVDAHGNLFIGDQNNNVVKEIPGGTGTPITIATGFATPDGVAVDAQGNVYVADDGNNLIKEVPFVNGAYQTPVVLASAFTFSQPFDVAVDSKGNVYAADRGHNQVVEIPVGGGAAFVIGSGFATPTGVSVDAYGNVYVADNGNSAIKMIPAGNGTPVTLGSGFSNPFTATVDGSGNVFVADYGNKQVKEIPINGGAIQTVGSGYSFIFGTAVDNLNNVYVTNYGSNAVEKIQPTGGYYINPALPLGLSFNNTTGTISGTPLAASPATNYTITAYNQYGGNSKTITITVNAVTMTYAGPQTYVAGSAITPLSPTGGGAAAPAYSTSTTTLGSGFNIPAGVAVDAHGNLFIGDQNNNVVKEIPGGTGTPITIATGFSTPDGVAVDAQGNVYVANDGANNIQEIPFTNGVYGAPVTLGGAFSFSQPFDVAVDNKGNVYAADRGHNQVVEIPVGGGAAFVIGSGFATPTGVSVDAYGNVYVADNGNSAIKMIPAGNGTPVTLGSGFANPFTATVDGSGNVFVADYGNKQVKEIPINGGAIQTVGSGYSFIFGTAVDNLNNVYVTDYGNNAVKKIQPTGGYYISPALPQGLSFNNTTGTISGTPIVASPATNYTITAWNQYGNNSTTLSIAVNAVTMSYTSPKTFVVGSANSPLSPTGGGAAAPAYSTSTTTLGSGFNIPAGVAVDAHGNLFIGDQNNNVVKEIPGGTGTPITIATGFATPDGVAVDAQGNVYVANDGGNNIQEVPFTNGVYGAPIVLGGNFSFSQPFDVAVDNKGNVYVADRGHNQVVEIPVGGGVAFTIGSGFATPTGVAVDAYGNVYVADNGNSAIKEIPVGGGAPVTLGSGFSNPFTVAVDGSGNLFVADYGNKQVKEIPINGGPIQTVGSGYSFIFGTAVDNVNNVYVTDYGNNAVKMIKPIGGYYISPALPQGLSFNNTTGIISGTPLAASPAANYTVTAYNGFGGNSATISIIAADNKNLSALVLSSGTLSPAFAGGTVTYTANVINTVSSITVTPTSTDPAATILVNGITVTSATPSQSLPLVVGPNTITITVVAQDGKSNKIYTVTVTRAPSSNANLAGLLTSKGTFSPAFASGTLNYTDAVGNTITSLTVTPTTSGGNATVKVNGTAVTSGTPSAPISLVVGPNTVTVVVTAQDGTTTKTYTITVNRALSADADLSSLKMSKGIFSPAFDSATTAYTDAIGNAITTVTVTPTTDDPNATVKVNGNPVTSGTPSNAISIPVGSKKITVTVTAQDGKTTKNYAVTVNRPGSNNDNLSSLKTSKGVFSPTFASGTLSYGDAVGNTITSITVTPTTSDPDATVSVNQQVIPSGTASAPINLAVGPNTVNVLVKASDGITTKTYTITVTRASSNNDNLSSLKMSKGVFSPTFASGTLSYDDAVGNAITSVTVTPTASDPDATIQVNQTPVPSGTASAPINLLVGPNTVNVLVTASDGQTAKIYTVTVTRASGSADSYDPGISVTKPVETPTLAEDGIQVHQGVSPNGDGINDFLTIDNISQYPDNKLSIMNRNGQLIYEASGYDNSSKVFDGHSNKNGKLQLPGTYFYQLDYTVGGITRHKTGFIVLKY